MAEATTHIAGGITRPIGAHIHAEHVSHTNYALATLRLAGLGAMFVLLLRRCGRIATEDLPDIDQTDATAPSLAVCAEPEPIDGSPQTRRTGGIRRSYEWAKRGWMDYRSWRSWAKARIRERRARASQEQGPMVFFACRDRAISKWTAMLHLLVNDYFRLVWYLHTRRRGFLDDMTNPN